MSLSVPELRVHALNDAPVVASGRHVLYWMVASRRTRWSFGLQHAVSLARELGKPLLILEPLRAGHRWASRRFHRFVLDGMVDNARDCERWGVRYLPYLERRAGEGRGLLQALARDACAVVTDEYPCFFLPRMVRRAGELLDVRLEQVDSNGLLPLRAAGKPFARAVDFRRHLQRVLAPHLAALPVEEPLRRLRGMARATVPRDVTARWKPVPAAVLRGDESATAKLLSALPVDQGVGEVDRRGGSRAGRAVLKRFVRERLDGYLDRNEPSSGASSGLSPYLHWGHVSAHEVFAAVTGREGWSPTAIGPKATGARHGWWGMSEAAESLLDQVVTWRELGYTFCFERPDDHDAFASLPGWALQTLRDHVEDPRDHVYDLEALEAAHTHDEIWNAAQRELSRDGVIHNYLRMLWGKRVLEWFADPEEACEALIELNNKLALDGRDPNSYSGIFWCFGRFDRAWGPERPVFGKVRYMSSANTARKLRLGEYLRKYASG